MSTTVVNTCCFAINYMSAKRSHQQCISSALSFLLCQAALATEADATAEILRTQLGEAQAKLAAAARVSRAAVYC